MTINSFKFHFARRNIQANKKNSIVVILTLSLIFCLSIMLLGLKPAATRIYELEFVEKYEDIDIVISYDEYSSSRLINRRSLLENYSTDIEYALSFFNLSVLVNQETPVYFNMLSGLPHDFERLVDEDVFLLENQVIITRSLADKYGLDIGSSFNFSIFTTEFDYTVGDIFEDRNQFSGDAFYIDKSIIMESLYGFSLDNLGNVVYIDCVNENSISDLHSRLTVDSEYDDYNIAKTIDWDYIDTRANDLVSMFLAVGLIIILAIFLVLDSLIPNVSKDIPKQLGVVRTLGGTKSFVWHVYLYQWIIYIVVSFVIGSILSVFVYNMALDVYGTDGFIPYDWNVGLIALFVLSFFIVIRARISYHQENIKSSVELSNHPRYKKYNTKVFRMMIIGVILLVECIFRVLPIKYHALVIVLTSVYLTFNMLSFVLILLSKQINKRKKSIFSLFQTKYLQTNKALHQSLRVLVVSLLALVMVYSFRVFMDDQIDDIRNLMSYDLALTNITNYDDNLLNDLEAYDVSSLKEASLYNHTTVMVGDSVEFSRYMVSIDYEYIDDYFDTEIVDFKNSYKDNSVAYAILPQNYKLIYHLEVGDIVKLGINYELEEIPVYVAGFVNNNIENLVYTNITEVEEYKDIAKHNTVFINSDNTEDLYLDLINDYSGRMYYLINPNYYFENMLSSSESLIDFFAVFTMFIIFCFVIVIFNNTVLVFNSLKTDLAKIKSLGANRLDFRVSVFKEYLLIIVLLILFGFLESLILSENLRYLVLFTHYYKDITATGLTILYGCLSVALVELLSYLYYFSRINRIEIIKEIKI